MARRRPWKKLVAIAAALLVWQFGAMALGRAMPKAQSLLLATPLTVAKRLWELVFEPDFFAAVGFTMLRIVGGFLLGLALGCLLAAVASRFRAAEVLLWPYITVVKSVPVASFVILILIWLGSRRLSIFIALLMVLPIVYTNVLQGLKSADRKLLQMADVFRLSWLRRLRYIRLPALKPYLTSACSVAVGLSWKAGVAAEVIGIPDGSIGEMLYEAKVYLSSGDLFAWTVVIVVLSVAFEKLFLALLKLGYRRLERS